MITKGALETSISRQIKKRRDIESKRKNFMDCHDVVGEMMFLSIVDEQLDDILLYWGWRILDSLV